jgi:hypothetical protein
LGAPGPGAPGVGACQLGAPAAPDPGRLLALRWEGRVTLLRRNATGIGE